MDRLHEAIERAREEWKGRPGPRPEGLSPEVAAYAAGHDAGMHWAMGADWQGLRDLCRDVMGLGNETGDWWEGDYFLLGFGRGADWVYCDAQFRAARHQVAEPARREAERN
jgi:hypothetical protein